MRNKHDALNCVAGDQTPSASEASRADLEHVAAAAHQWHRASAGGEKNDHPYTDKNG